MSTLAIDFPPGTSIEDCAKALVMEAKRVFPKKVEFSFNGCVLTATSETDADHIVEYYRQSSIESSARFKASAEGQRLEAEALAYKQRIRNAADPGLTIYSYELDNTSGEWENIDRGIWMCFELWDGVKYIDACVGCIPDEWPKSANISGKDSPDRRIT
jgi:hypothetical protein